MLNARHQGQLHAVGQFLEAVLKHLVGKKTIQPHGETMLGQHIIELIVHLGMNRFLADQGGYQTLELRIFHKLTVMAKIHMADRHLGPLLGVFRHI